MPTDHDAPPVQRIGSSGDLDALRGWAFATLAGGGGAVAVDTVEEAQAAGRWVGDLFELQSEVCVRAGIALDDPALVEAGLAPRRIDDGHEAVRLARRAPVSLIAARDALRRARASHVGSLERVTLVYGALDEVARACEPSWPVHGGPWWISDICGLTVDVSEPTDATGRNRFALADALMELEDLPPFMDEGEAQRALDAHRLGLADAILAHAVRAELAT
jgi:hypothetical protein